MYLVALSIKLWVNLSMQILAVIIASFIHMFLGALWYSPALFGKKWMKLNKITKKSIEEAKKQGMQKEHTLSFISIIFTNIGLLFLLQSLNTITLISGLLYGLMLGIFFSAATTFPNYVYENKSFSLWGINSGYPVIALALNGMLMTFFI